MKPKEKLFLTLFLFITSIAFAQDNTKEIDSQFTDYLNSIINQDFEKSMDYMAEDLFKILPKEQMVLMMEKTFNNPAMEFELKEPKILKIDDSQQIEGKHYAVLTYSNLINMKFLIDEEETEDEHKLRINLTKLALINTFGSGNVKHNEKTDFFKIYSEKHACAISANGKTGWKFLVLDKEQKFILEQLLPKQIIDTM